MQHTRLRRLSPEAYESSVAALLAFVCLDDLQGGGARHGAAGSNKPRMDSLAAGAVHQCYMRRTVQHVLVAPFHQGEQHQRQATAFISQNIFIPFAEPLPVGTLLSNPVSVMVFNRVVSVWRVIWVCDSIVSKRVTP